MPLRPLGSVDLSGLTAKLQAAQDKADRAMTKANAAADAAATATSTATSAAQTGSAAHQVAVDAESVASNLSQAIAGSEIKHAAMDAATAELKARLDAQGFATGEAGTPTIALAASVDVTITLSRPMPNAGYRVDVLRGAALIGRTEVTVKTKTTTQVVLTIKATLIVSTGSSVAVVATS